MKFTGTSIITLNATDQDTGVNAEILYHIERGAFEDFTIANKTGLIRTASKLDFDRKNQYNITVTATDGGKINLQILFNAVFSSRLLKFNSKETELCNSSLYSNFQEHQY